jgi:hypothetical protein
LAFGVYLARHKKVAGVEVKTDNSQNFALSVVEKYFASLAAELSVDTHMDPFLVVKNVWTVFVWNDLLTNLTTC